MKCYATKQIFLPMELSFYFQTIEIIIKVFNIICVYSICMILSMLSAKINNLDLDTQLVYLNFYWFVHYLFTPFPSSLNPFLPYFLPSFLSFH